MSADKTWNTNRSKRSSKNEVIGPSAPIGRITEWVVISNLENRAVNAACDKGQEWWKNRKHKKHGEHPPSAAGATPPPPMPPPDTKPTGAFASYAPVPAPPQPSATGPAQLSVTINSVDGLNQWGPLMVIIECNHQRYQINLGQPHQPFLFPIYQFDYDQLFIWIQAQYQQQTIAHGEIPVRILLNGNNNWAPAQQRWIPLRDQSNGPAGQLLVTAEYQIPYGSMPPGPLPPPPYSYYQ